MEVAAVFPLRLSLAPLLPLRLAEAKAKVPCLRPAELAERCALVDLCGAMMVVVVIVMELVRVDVEVGMRDTNLM